MEVVVIPFLLVNSLETLTEGSSDGAMHMLVSVVPVGMVVSMEVVGCDCDGCGTTMVVSAVISAMVCQSAVDIDVSESVIVLPGLQLVHFFVYFPFPGLFLCSFSFSFLFKFSFMYLVSYSLSSYDRTEDCECIPLMLMSLFLCRRLVFFGIPLVHGVSGDLRISSDWSR